MGERERVSLRDGERRLPGFGKLSLLLMVMDLAAKKRGGGNFRRREMIFAPIETRLVFSSMDWSPALRESKLKKLDSLSLSLSGILSLTFRPMSKHTRDKFLRKNQFDLESFGKAFGKWVIWGRGLLACV